MNWKTLDSIAGLEAIKSRSFETPCLIFKHSTRCEISAIAKHRLESGWDFGPEILEPFFLDLIAFRPVSSAIAEDFEVHHESPQALLIQNGECIFDASHLDISVDELREALAGVAA